MRGAYDVMKIDMSSLLQMTKTDMTSLLQMAKIDISNILQPGSLLAWLLVGLVAGFFASAFIRGRSYGCIGNIIVGLVGAFIGGFLTSLLDLGHAPFGFLGTVIVAFIGACIFVAFLQLIRGNRSW